METDPAAGIARIRTFFELAKAFKLGTVLQSPVDYRRVLEILTSNLVLKGKTLFVALRSPFREIAQGLALLSGAPHRIHFRTCTAHSAGEGSCDCPYEPSTPEQRAKVLYEALKGWAPPPELCVSDTHAKNQNSGWFKSRRPPPGAA